MTHLIVVKIKRLFLFIYFIIYGIYDRNLSSNSICSK